MKQQKLLCQNQHDDLKKQYYELQEQHQVEGEDHSRLLDEHRDRYDKLQQMKEVEISQLKGTDAHIHCCSCMSFIEKPQYSFL